MKLGKNYFEESKSSFLSVDKDLSIITNKLLQNDKLCKLLYYTQTDCLEAPDLNMKEKISMLNKQIKIIPKIDINKDCPNYIIIGMGNFKPTNNPEFRDCNITVDILCHPDHWSLGDFSLRPYKIAGEIDAMLDEQKLTGIGEIHFLSGDNLILNDQLMGLTLLYEATHGVEDEINPLTD